MAVVSPRPNAHQRGGGAEHFPHARPALGAFVAEHDYIAGVDFSGVDGFVGLFLGVEHPGRAGVGQHRLGHAGLLDHGRLRGQAGP